MVNKATKKKIQITLARRNLYDFCCVRVPKIYNKVDYLKELCDIMQEFIYDDNELLVVNLPPRHAKSLTATYFVQWLFGVDSSVKVMTASYNERLSRRFSKSTRNGISETKVKGGNIVYSDIFPKTKIAYGSASVDLWKLANNNYENYLATSPTSTATGLGADFIIIDDIIKSAYEANHSQKKQEHYDWFTDTMYSRLEGKRKVMLIMTRWASDDLAGRLIELYEEQNRKYIVFSRKAFNNGKMLNENILSLNAYELLRQTVSEEIVQANYNQYPIDLDGALYTEFKTYTTLPKGRIFSHCDPADTGKDFLCLITYLLTDNNEIYVLDILYTQKNIDYTISEIAHRLINNYCEMFFYENNFGGRAFGRAVRTEVNSLISKLKNQKDEKLKEHLRLIEVADVGIKGYKQTLNKEARIYSESSNVTRRIIMPDGWDKLFPAFYSDITKYQRKGKNEHDDAPDTLTAIVEKWRE